MKQGQKEVNLANAWYGFFGLFAFSVKELETFLSPEFLEKASLTDDAKADIIIAGEKKERSI